MSLASDIKNWDGKTASDIGEIFQAHEKSKEFLPELISLIGRCDTEAGASWILKAWLEAGNSLSKEQTAAVFKHLAKLDNWQAKLHLLQCLPHLSIAARDRRKLEKFLRQTLTDTNKFVRAWSYSGFHYLARAFPEYKDEAMHFFDLAMQDEPASVKARIRQVMKKPL